MASSPARPGLPLICLALNLLLAGCGTGVLGDGDERLDDLDAVPPWFERHRGELEVIMRLLLPHASIHRVELARPWYLVQHGRFSPADEAAYAGAFAIKRRLGISEVIVRRPEGRSPSFTFVLWRIGLAISGRSTSIHYDEDKASVLQYYGSPPDRALDLGAPNWAAVRSSSD